MVIFDRKMPQPELTRGEVPGTIYGLSSNGWIDSDLFCLWFSNHFLAYAPPSHPFLLLLDRHFTHFNPLTIELAAKEQVVVFCLPPYSSHRTQPLDKGCFGPLKQYLRQECHDYLIKNPGKVVTCYEFSQLFSQAWLKGMSMSNILGGFKNTGVYPFNRGALLSQSPVQPSLSQRTGLNYIPLFSPVPSRPVRALTSVPEISTGVDDNTQEELGTQTKFLEVMPPVPFTPEEISLFERRFEEGYNFYDSRYDLWLSLNHESATICNPNSENPPHLSFDSYSTPPLPHSATCWSPEHSPPMQSVCLQHSSTLSRMIEQQPPAMKPKTSARVLTSEENCKMLMVKEKEKAEKVALKEERKAERARKKEEKLKEQEKRKKARVEKELNKCQEKVTKKTGETFTLFLYSVFAKAIAIFFQ